MQRVKDASAASLMPFVEESVESGSVVVTDDWAGYDPLKKKDYQRRIITIKHHREPASELLPRVHLAISLLKRWLLGTHKGRSATSIWTTISTSSCSASTGAAHAVAASSSTGWCSRPWQWSRTPYRSILAKGDEPFEPNHKILGSPESSGYPAAGIPRSFRKQNPSAIDSAKVAAKTVESATESSKRPRSNVRKHWH